MTPVLIIPLPRGMVTFFGRPPSACVGSTFCTKGCVQVHNFGLAQHHFDVPKDAPAPGDPPDYNPVPGGNPDYPMPDQAFMPVTLGTQTFADDGVHPDEDTYKRVVLRDIDQCYQSWFAEPPDPLPVCQEVCIMCMIVKGSTRKETGLGRMFRRSRKIAKRTPTI